MEMNYQEIDRIITAALAEDIGKGDITAQLLIEEGLKAQLAFITREPMVMCGGFIVPLVFAKLHAGIQVKIDSNEGEAVAAGTVLIEVSGQARSIMSGERVALNLLQRMASVATLTARYVEAVKGTKAIILDTRKTMPGLRELDKYAVRAGGAANHRMRLDDAILIKDNHIALCGSVKAALERARLGNRDNLMIEVECDTLAQVEEALQAGAQRIMLDNMSLENMRAAVGIAAGNAKLEASGNVNLDTVRAIAKTGVDYISIGKLTHSVVNVDIGLDSVTG